MKMLFLAFLALFMCSQTMAQINLTYPTSSAVFQRNNNNDGIIYFGGNLTKRTDRIDARLVPINGGQFSDWQTVSENPSNGYFKAEIWAKGGWYKLEVRAVFRDEVIASSSISPVGVGEVFVISGQSNAQGIFEYNQKGASDERVVRISNFISTSENLQPFPFFSQVYAQSSIAPTGRGAWCWGELGDYLVKRLNVPVLFINTAFEGLPIKAWTTSAEGGFGVNPFSGLTLSSGFPFNSLKNALQQYIPITGIRAVLMHQGESDNYIGTSEDEYFQEMSKTIQNTRNVSEKYLSWVVSRASRYEFSSGAPQIIAAQNRVVQSNGNVFFGPETDWIDDRTDGVHFNQIGLSKLASEWNKYLDDSFFRNSNPYLASSPILVNNSCNPSQSNPITLTLPDNYATYIWGTSNYSKSIQVSEGIYQGRVVNGNGLQTFTVPFQNSGLRLETPYINTNQQPTTFCEGNSIRMTTNFDYNNEWSNGSWANELTVGSSGDYRVTHYNFLGCPVTSVPVYINVKPSPNPQIASASEYIACSNDSIQLKSNYESGNLWSTSQTQNTIKLYGKHTITLKVTNAEGCSATTEPIEINIKPVAEKPSVRLVGKTEFCANENVYLIGVSQYATNNWNDGETNDTIKIKNTGTYYYTTTNEYDCKAVSDAISLVVNPVPEKPTITVEGPTVYCDDTTSLLRSTIGHAYQWNNGDTTQTIRLNIGGNYQVKFISDKGCVSVPSDPVFLEVYQVPNKPVVFQSGSYSLETMDLKNENIKYEWFLNDTMLNKQAALIKATESGVYKVRVNSINQTRNHQLLSCLSKFSQPYQFTIGNADKGFSIFPNPVLDGILSVETLEDVENSKINIYDMLGNLVKSYSVPIFEAKKTIDVKDLHSGMYIIQIKNNRYQAVKKILIN